LEGFIGEKQRHSFVLNPRIIDSFTKV